MGLHDTINTLYGACPDFVVIVLNYFQIPRNNKPRADIQGPLLAYCYWTEFSILKCLGLTMKKGEV